MSILENTNVICCTITKWTAESVMSVNKEKEFGTLYPARNCLLTTPFPRSPSMAETTHNCSKNQSFRKVNEHEGHFRPLCGLNACVPPIYIVWCGEVINWWGGALFNGISALIKRGLRILSHSLSTMRSWLSTTRNRVLTRTWSCGTLTEVCYSCPKGLRQCSFKMNVTTFTGPNYSEWPKITKIYLWKAVEHSDSHSIIFVIHYLHSVLSDDIHCSSFIISNTA